jgi:hypothetical protein
MSSAAAWFKKARAAAEATDAERKADADKRAATKDDSSSSSSEAKQPEAAAAAANGQQEGSSEPLTTLTSHAQVGGGLPVRCVHVLGLGRCWDGVLCADPILLWRICCGTT